jgi:2-dehydro-3-deoxygluconokinase
MKADRDAIAPLSLVARAEDQSRWDLVALGEVMLRLDPGEGRIHTAREFQVWEGGGEYNVARGLRRCFRMSTAIVTALADNAIGRLIEDLMLQGGVNQSHLRWVPYDGVGRSVRNGINFTERGFGLRAGRGCSDRGHTAASKLRAGEIDWETIFGAEGARWFHTGGIFAALGKSTPDVAAEAIACAREHGTLVSYDLNYRPSLWQGSGGRSAARRVNRRLVEMVDVLLGNEEDFTAALGFEVNGLDSNLTSLDPANFARMIDDVVAAFPNLRVVATTLRGARTATRNDWSAICWVDGKLYRAREYSDLEILDRVGGGDSFASGLIYGFLTGQGPQQAVEYGAAHGALAMTTPGDTSMVTLEEVMQATAATSARIVR